MMDSMNREENKIIEELYLAIQLVLVLFFLNLGFPLLSNHYSLDFRYYSIAFAVFIVIKLARYAFFHKGIHIVFALVEGLFTMALVILSAKRGWHLTDIFYLYLIIQQMRYQDKRVIVFPFYTAMLHTCSCLFIYGRKLAINELAVSVLVYFSVSWLISFVYKHLNALHKERDYFYTEIVKKNEELSKLASTDYLTDLSNHQAFYHCYHQMYQRSQNSNDTFGLLLIDIDNFKSINDTYGHLEGDRILKSIARIIVSEVRRSDLVARYGGEEFAVLLPNTDVNDAYVMAERIRYKIECTSFVIKSIVVRITVSMGASVFNASLHDAQHAKAFIEDVDQLLYTAKKTGKNKVVCP